MESETKQKKIWKQRKAKNDGKESGKIEEKMQRDKSGPKPARSGQIGRESG